MKIDNIQENLKDDKVLNTAISISNSLTDKEIVSLCSLLLTGVTRHIKEEESSES